MPSKKALIIGAGIAGIATAIRLAVKGYDVEVFEANSYAGGKLSEITQDGFRFDAGPSLLTMPQYIDDLFQLAGKDPADFFQYQKLDVNCNYFFADGQQLIAYADLAKFGNEVKRFSRHDAVALQKHAAKSSRIYQITNHVFLERSLHLLNTYLRWDTLTSIFNFGGIDAFRTMHRANQSFFEDEKMVQFYDRYATYNGSNPYQAPATLNVIPHFEQHFGAYFPKHGMYSITTSLVKLAESIGVKFNYNSVVDEIVAPRTPEERGIAAVFRLFKRNANGLMVNGSFVDGDLVVSNMDVWFTYHRLLKSYPKLHPRKILAQERSSSALIFYWGVNKKSPKLDLHNIFFSADYKAEFDAIWQQKTISNDPTVYVNISSKLKPDDAPNACENWFVMINVPANSGQNWDELIEKARKDIIKKLSGAVGEDVSKLIICESILDPRSIESKTSSYQGSLYGTSSNSKFAAFLRHANKSSKIKNLYFCGGSVHPGGGIPLALLSAKIVCPPAP